MSTTIPVRQKNNVCDRSNCQNSGITEHCRLGKIYTSFVHFKTQFVCWTLISKLSSFLFNVQQLQNKRKRNYGNSTLYSWKASCTQNSEMQVVLMNHVE